MLFKVTVAASCQTSLPKKLAQSKGHCFEEWVMRITLFVLPLIFENGSSGCVVWRKVKGRIYNFIRHNYSLFSLTSSDHYFLNIVQSGSFFVFLFTNLAPKVFLWVYVNYSHATFFKFFKNCLQSLKCVSTLSLQPAYTAVLLAATI